MTIAGALGEYWFLTGFWVEGAALIDSALAVSHDETGVSTAPLALVQRARVCGTYAGAAAGEADMEAAIAIAEQHGRPDIAREAQTWRGLARARSGRFVEAVADLSAVASDAAAIRGRRRTRGCCSAWGWPRSGRPSRGAPSAIGRRGRSTISATG